MANNQRSTSNTQLGVNAVVGAAKRAVYTALGLKKPKHMEESVRRDVTMNTDRIFLYLKISSTNIMNRYVQVIDIHRHIGEAVGRDLQRHIKITIDGKELVRRQEFLVADVGEGRSGLTKFIGKISTLSKQVLLIRLTLPPWKDSDRIAQRSAAKGGTSSGTQQEPDSSPPPYESLSPLAADEDGPYHPPRNAGRPANTPTQPRPPGNRGPTQSAAPTGGRSTGRPGRREPNPPSQSARTRTCDICAEDRNINDFPPMITMECEHFNEQYCLACIKQIIKTGLENATTWEKIACPGCNLKLTFVDVIMHADEQDMQKYDQYAVKAVLDQDNDFQYCPSGKCGYGYFLEPGTEVFSCSACKKNYCIKHRCVWHERETCDQYDLRTNAGARRKKEEEETKKILERTTVNCPKCKIPIEKNGGCDHITCKKCFYEFCYRCLAGWRNNGRDNNKHKRGCPYYKRGNSITRNFDIMRALNDQDRTRQRLEAAEQPVGNRGGRDALRPARGPAPAPAPARAPTPARAPAPAPVPVLDRDRPVGIRGNPFGRRNDPRFDQAPTRGTAFLDDPYAGDDYEDDYHDRAYFDDDDYDDYDDYDDELDEDWGFGARGGRGGDLYPPRRGGTLTAILNVPPPRDFGGRDYGYNRDPYRRFW